ncbi:hypothetical protein [Pedobacter terrae]|uniref:hypothetical protein n=1 Tax=Pedobacter terrae TaxID=405671 RepID=UPI002FF84010
MTGATQGIKGFKVLQPSPAVDDLVSLVETRLPLFTSSNSFEKILVTKKNETQHSTAFILFMMKDQDKFTFMNETGQKGSFTIDIGVYERATDELIFTIEAKVLPTPKGTKANPRSESEYVFSQPGHRGAGLERFKAGNHGLNNAMEPLPINGMIAYVKDSDFSSWLITINGWIKRVAWDASEELQQSYINDTAKFISEHLRADGTQLTIHHFWVKVT